jgi:hypothetical protein
LIGRGCGDEEAVFVAGSQAADNACARDCAVDEWDEVCELGFEDAVEVCAGAEGDEAVAVGEGGEDADSGRMLVRRKRQKRLRNMYSFEFSNIARTAMAAELVCGVGKADKAVFGMCRRPWRARSRFRS